jgi:hypothetical protein
VLHWLVMIAFNQFAAAKQQQRLMQSVSWLLE